MATSVVTQSAGSLFSSKIPTTHHVEVLDSPRLNSKSAGENGIYTINDLLVQRAQFMPDVSLLAYPGSQKGKDDYLHYTARDLDRFANEAAKKYLDLGISPKVNNFMEVFYIYS